MSEIEYSSLFGSILISEPWATSLDDIERQLYAAFSTPGPIYGDNREETLIDQLIRVGIIKDRSQL